MDEETIRKTAYRIWEEKGKPHGEDFEHWYQARNELDDNANDGLPGSISSSVAQPDSTFAAEDASAVATEKPAKRKSRKN